MSVKCEVGWITSRRLPFCSKNSVPNLVMSWSREKMYQALHTCKIRVPESLGTSLAMDTFFGFYFHFCLELALECWVKALLMHSLWVHDLDHTHSLASFQWSGLSDQKNCLQFQRCSPKKCGGGGGMVSIPICAKLISEVIPTYKHNYNKSNL